MSLGTQTATLHGWRHPGQTSTQWRGGSAPSDQDQLFACVNPEATSSAKGAESAMLTIPASTHDATRDAYAEEL